MPLFFAPLKMSLHFNSILREFSITHSNTSSPSYQFFATIYSEPAVIKSLLPSLSPLAKSLLQRMALIGRPVPLQAVKQWTVMDCSGALKELLDLRLILSEGEALTFHPSARETYFRLLMTGGHGVVQEGARSPSSRYTEALDWSNILSRAIGASSSALPPVVEKALQLCSLGRQSPDSYRFVLSDRTLQIWTLIRKFLLYLETSGGLGSFREAIVVLAGLLSGPTDSTVPAASPAPSEKSSRKSAPTISMFYELLTGLGVSFDGDCLPYLRGSDAVSDGLLNGTNIILDSNLHITAYTVTPLQLRIIGLFADIRRHLGSAVAAIISRRSIWRAGQAGVDADKVIAFLNQGKMPANVIAQIRLWEKDSIEHRLRITPGVRVSYQLPGTPEAIAEYQRVRALAEAGGALLAIKESVQSIVLLLDQEKAVALRIVAGSD